MVNPSDLESGRYTLVEVDQQTTGFEPGAMIDSMRLRDEVGEGVYPNGTILMHVVSGELFHVRITLEPVPFNSLQPRQKQRANSYRDHWWPSAEVRPRPAHRK